MKNSLGILGGGQLGMFICQAAKNMILKRLFSLITKVLVQKNFVIVF